MKKVHQPHNKDFKFKYKRMSLKIHNWLFHKKYKKIEFKDTAEAETGKQKDLVYTQDGEYSFHTEGESTPINPDDSECFYKYYLQTLCDKSNGITSLKSYCICTAKPQKGNYKHVDNNLTFNLQVIYPQNFDGGKVLSTLKDKVEKQKGDW